MGKGANSQRSWSVDEMRMIEVYYPSHGSEWEGWSEVLGNRSKKAIRRKASLMGVECDVERKRRESQHGDTDKFRYDFVQMADPYEGFVLRMLNDGKTLRQIDACMHWHPGKAKLILTERWKREEKSPERRSGDNPKRFPAYTVDIDGLVRKYNSWAAWKNNALKAEGEERVYRKMLGEHFDVYETFE